MKNKRILTLSGGLLRPGDVAKSMLSGDVCRGWSMAFGDINGKKRSFQMAYMVGHIKDIIDLYEINPKKIPACLLNDNWLFVIVIDDDDFDIDNPDSFVHYHTYIASVKNPTEFSHVATFSHNEIGYWDSMFEWIITEKKALETAIKSLSDKGGR